MVLVAVEAAVAGATGLVTALTRRLRKRLEVRGVGVGIAIVEASVGRVTMRSAVEPYRASVLAPPVAAQESDFGTICPSIKTWQGATPRPATARSMARCEA